MNFYSLLDLPADHQREKTFKTWPAPKILAVVIFFFLGGLLIYLGYRGGYQSGEVRLYAEGYYWVGGVLLFLGGIALYFARNSLDPGNWLLKVSPERLLIKYRSYHNHHFPQEDPVVVEISTGDMDPGSSRNPDLSFHG